MREESALLLYQKICSLLRSFILSLLSQAYSLLATRRAQAPAAGGRSIASLLRKTHLASFSRLARAPYAHTALHTRLTMRCRSSPLAVAAFALAASIPAFAQVTPTAPGPGDSYRVGADCIAEWDPDSTGVRACLLHESRWRTATRRALGRGMRELTRWIIQTWTSFDIDLMSGSNTAMVIDCSFDRSAFADLHSLNRRL